MSASGQALFIEGPGPRIACEVLGAGPDAPTLLFAHGNSSHRGVWRPVARLLPRELDVRSVLMDMRGHGDSEHVHPPAYNPADHATDLERVARHLAPSRLAVIGHSAGALAVTAFAARCARGEADCPRPSALAWVDIDPCVPSWQVEFFHARADGIRRSHADADTAIRQLIRGIQKTSVGVSEEALWDFIATGLKQTPEGFSVKFDSQTYATWSPGDLRSLLPLVDIPALLIRAGDSIVTSEQGMAELQTGFPRSTRVDIPGGTHFVPLDHPEELARALARFLQQEWLSRE
ncbi:alpha/beta fold hydrolase [Cystobacter fuscus]|uniref:alpha/beta fold hydrolase n=1 Tax=Cystobacter fuscus TaxID=43 RepID=UPI002B2EE6B0|nr:alpha/beta hydrolase [Cystobacter fuscus]